MMIFCRAGMANTSIQVSFYGLFPLPRMAGFAPHARSSIVVLHGDENCESVDRNVPCSDRISISRCKICLNLMHDYESPSMANVRCLHSLYVTEGSFPWKALALQFLFLNRLISAG
jgi:hypothetical protein